MNIEQHFMDIKEGSNKSILEYVGDISQIADVQEVRLAGGRSDGVRAVIVTNGSGLEYTVLPDRGMDILSVKYKGIPLHYRTGTGVTSPMYYNDRGTSWLRSFYSGALTTCGLTYIGQPQKDQGVELGLHGRISNTPAEDFGIFRGWSDDEYLLNLRGVMKEVSAFGENLSLTRRIETKMGRKGFRITDVVRNQGFGSVPLMILYHFNFGYPFLNPESRIIGPVISVKGGDEFSQSREDLDNFDKFGTPVKEYTGRLFFHTLGADENGRTFIAIINNRRSQRGRYFGVVLRFDIDILPHLVEWKVIERQYYIVCLEPSNCLPVGREALRESGRLPHLEGLEEKEIVIDYDIIDSPEEIRILEAEAERIKKANKRKT